MEAAIIISLSLLLILYLVSPKVMKTLSTVPDDREPVDINELPTIDTPEANELLHKAQSATTSPQKKEVIAQLISFEVLIVDSITIENEVRVEALRAGIHGQGMAKILPEIHQLIAEGRSSLNKNASTLWDVEELQKMLDTFAFALNLLALNTAVEAARAGVHGKGFARVAEQVRELAAEAAMLSKQIYAAIHVLDEGAMK
ncbi:MAG: hypothetical protein HRT88_07090 [Lentisphaeraceae bacterium]|nr:hypothetical protein [Lentisphaeraceae bacterium]